MPDLTASASSPPDGPADAVYGARYYETYTGGAYEFEGEWVPFFNGLADRIVTQFNPRTVLDAGCAKGFLVHVLRERNVEAYGIDVSEYAIANAVESVRPHVRVASMTEPLDRRYDLITCIEVIEHVPPDQVEAAVATLAAATDTVLLSTTGEPEHYGEPSHTTMKGAEDWAALFARHGFLRDLDIDVTYVSPWAMVLRRSGVLTVPEVVRTYDRRVARYQRETIELRQTALRLVRELEEVEANGELARLRAREERAVAALTETLRQRDLHIVSERALGQARGDIRRLEDQLHGHDELVAHHHALLNSTTWRLIWKLMTPYRRLREKLHI
jgi:SAM-dependent methyltransferase